MLDPVCPPPLRQSDHRHKLQYSRRLLLERNREDDYESQIPRDSIQGYFAKDKLIILFIYSLRKLIPKLSLNPLAAGTQSFAP